MTSEIQPLSELPERRRALIVDDDIDLAESLSDILVARGYEVQMANSHQEALDHCLSFDAQVALLDIRLHGESGLDVLAMLKQHNPDMVCVMITGFAETETAIDALRRGAYDYLSKPLHPDQLFAMLDRCFDKIRLEQDAKSAYEAMCTAKGGRRGRRPGQDGVPRRHGPRAAHAAPFDHRFFRDTGERSLR